MMNKFKQIGCSVILALGIAAPASAFQTFSVNAQSDGFAGIDFTALEYMDFIGNSFIQNTFANPVPVVGDAFTFVDDGIFKVTGVDGVPAASFGGNELTSLFVGGGNGTLGGSITFTNGTLQIFSDAAEDYGTANGIYGANNGNLIGTFDLTTGFAAIDNEAVPNGFITLSFQATNLAANTWFDEFGNDLSLNPSTLAFVTSNATRLEAAGGTLAQELICGQAGFNCPSGTPFDNTPFNFLVSNNGQYRMSTEVPEPTSLALLGIGLLGFAFRRQYRA